MTDDLYRLTALECVRRLRAGELTPLDLIDAVERRAAAVNGAVNALVTPCYDRAREHARRLMKLPPHERGLLAGLPVGDQGSQSESRACAPPTARRSSPTMSRTCRTSWCKPSSPTAASWSA